MWLLKGLASVEPVRVRKPATLNGRCIVRNLNVSVSVN